MEEQRSMSSNTPGVRRTTEATLISRWFLKSYELTEGSQRHYTGNRKLHGYVALPSSSHNFPRTNTYHQNSQVFYSFLPFNPFSFFLSAYSFSSCILEALGYHLSAVTQVFVILFSPCTQIAEINLV